MNFLMLPQAATGGWNDWTSISFFLPLCDACWPPSTLEKPREIIKKKFYVSAMKISTAFPKERVQTPLTDE
jgi:hypothetical protein